MKVVALITHSSAKKHYNQWQFDKILAAIAYDLTIEIIFINEGITQIIDNKYWNSLSIYGINNVYYISDNSTCRVDVSDLSIDCTYINQDQFNKMLNNADYCL